MTNTTVTENKMKLSKEQKKLVRSVFWRTMWLMFCTSYTKQQGTTFAWTMIPYLEDIYGKETDEFYEARAICRICARLQNILPGSRRICILA